MSSGNLLSYVNNTTTYWICAQNTDGGTVWVYNSASGGAVAKSTQTTFALCVSNGN